MCWSKLLKNYGSRLRSKWHTFFYNYPQLIIKMTLTFTNETQKAKPSITPSQSRIYY